MDQSPNGTPSSSNSINSPPGKGGSPGSGSFPEKQTLSQGSSPPLDPLSKTLSSPTEAVTVEDSLSLDKTPKARVSVGSSTPQDPMPPSSPSDSLPDEDSLTLHNLPKPVYTPPLTSNSDTDQEDKDRVMHLEDSGLWKDSEDDTHSE